MSGRLKEVILDGDVIILRVFENDQFQDKVFMRDLRTERSNNCWFELPDYGKYVALYKLLSAKNQEE